MNNKLAISGGEPIRKKGMPHYNSLGKKEEKAALRVMRNGILSNFYGSNSPNFFGGKEVQKLEREWEAAFDVKYAVSMNSATSALYAAFGAIDVGPGDEVICPPTTMTASVTGVILYGAVPRFADIEIDRHCIDPKSIEKNITPKTKAIMVVHLFGQPAAMDEIMAIAKKHNLKVIEDAAQSPLAYYKDKASGTIGDIGVYSLNCHKVIQCGEGGIAVTNNEDLAKRLQLIRNHGEQVISQGFKVENQRNMIGFNYRLTEIQAAIAREQLKKLPEFNAYRQKIVNYLRSKIAKYDFFEFAPVRENCTHVYYVPVWNYYEEKLGISRNTLVVAVNAEGFPEDYFCGGYVLPIYLQRWYQEKELQPLAFRLPENQPLPPYNEGICPVAEDLWKNKFIETNFCTDAFGKKDINQFIEIIDKIVENIEELKEREKFH